MTAVAACRSRPRRVPRPRPAPEPTFLQHTAAPSSTRRRRSPPSSARRVARGPPGSRRPVGSASRRRGAAHPRPPSRQRRQGPLRRRCRQDGQLGIVPSARPGSVDVKVPQLANNGRLVLLDPPAIAPGPARRAFASCATRTPRARPARVAAAGEGHDHRVFGENRGDHMHSGLDIAVPSGTRIKAAAAGTVILPGQPGRLRKLRLHPAHEPRDLLRPPVRLRDHVRRVRAPGPDDRARRVHR